MKETEFKTILIDNYSSDRIFRFELDAGQVAALCRKFKSDIPSPSIVAKKFAINNFKHPAVPKPMNAQFPRANLHVINKNSEISKRNSSNNGVRSREGHHDSSFKSALMAATKAMSTLNSRSLSPAPAQAQAKKKVTTPWVSKKVESKVLYINFN